MPIHIKEVNIPRIPQLGNGQWTLKNLTEITVIFGRNGSGKSVLLRSWRNQSENNIHYVTPERTGEMDHQPQLMREELEPSGRKNASTRNFVLNYRQRVLARIQGYFMNRGNYRGEGTPLGSPVHIEKFVSDLLTDFNLKVNGSETIPYELNRIDSNEIIRSVDQLSSGEAQLVTIGLDILTIASIWEINNLKNGIILIDEPDAHIHPDLQARFADFLFQIEKHFKLQLVVATHSTSLLAALGQFGGEKASVIYLNRKNADYRAQQFNSVQKELSACLGGHVLMGPLFGCPILLVEGDDDYRIWSQVPRHHITSFAVIPCNGDEIKNYQKTLEKIFTSLRENDEEPCGFALIDNDKSFPEPNENNPQRNIKFIQLSCHESENLYLTDEVLADMGLTWELAKKKIEENAHLFSEKKDRLLSVHSWDRKTEDIKQLIHQIAQIIDPKLLSWTVRLGRVLGKARPQGQLAEFLNETVVNSLWNRTNGV